MSEVNLVPITSTNAPRYKYYTVDLVSNQIIGEIPFEDVNYELGLKQAGSFDGKITVSEQTDNLNLYNATLPGKTGLFILRDDTCVWGGIIWGRTYDMLDRSLSVSASEFTSYLSHRLIWKTNSYSYVATLVKDTLSSNVHVMLDTKVLDTPLEVYTNGSLNYVYVGFTETATMSYSSYYNLTDQPSAPGNKDFYLSIPSLPAGTYKNVSITAKVDTYQYIRNILSDVFNDYINVDFANEFAQAGVRIPNPAATVQLTVSNKDSNGYGTAGTATITTKDSHNLTVGQRVELANIDPTLNGIQTISEVLNPYTFKFNLLNPQTKDKDGNVVPIYLQDIFTTSLTETKNYVQYREISPWPPQYITKISRTGGQVTLTFSKKHGFDKGEYITIVTENKAPVMFKVNSSDTNKTNTVSYTASDTAVTIDSVPSPTQITFTDSAYSDAKYDIATSSSSVNDTTKNYATLAVPIYRLTLSFNGSHGYVPGDQLKISGVDGLDWNSPLYNGYVNVLETNDGLTYSIYAYKKVANSARLYFSIGALDNLYAGDTAVMSGINNYFNGEYVVAFKDREIIAGTTYDYIQYVIPGPDVAYTVASSGALLTKSGNSWIDYFTPYDQQQDTQYEVDATSTIKYKKYAITDSNLRNTTGKTSATVTITTKERHNIRVGDTVAITLNPTDYDKSTQKNYAPDTNYVVTNSSPLTNQFSYKISNIKDKKDFSTSPQTGTVTRIKTKIGAVTTRSTSISYIATNGDKVTAFTADGNPFIDGDYAIISFDGTNFDGFENGGVPVLLFDCTSYSFSYRSNAKLPAKKGAGIGSIASGLDSNSQPTLTFTTAAASEVASTSRSRTIDSVDSSTPSAPIFHTTTAHGATVGETVLLSGFTSTSTTTSNVASTTSNISKLTYDDAKGILTLVLSTNHNSPVVGSLVSVSDLVDGTYNSHYQKLSVFNKSSVTVSSIVDSKTLKLKYPTGTKSSITVAITPGAGSVVCPIKSVVSAVTPNVGVFNAKFVVSSIVDANRFTVSTPSRTEVFGTTSVSVAAAFDGFTTSTSKHGLAVGDIVYLKNFVDEIVSSYGGVVPFSTLNDLPLKVITVPTDTTFTVGSPFVQKTGSEYSFTTYNVSNSPYILASNFVAAGFAYMDYRETTPGIKNVTHVLRSNATPNVVTATVVNHNLSVGDYATLWIHGTNGGALNSANRVIKITSVPDVNTFTYPLRGTSPVTTSYIKVKSNVATIYFDSSAANPFLVGDSVILSGFSSPYSSAFTGTKTITTSGSTFICIPVTYANGTYSTTGTITMSTPVTFDSDVTGIVVPAPMVTRSPTVFTRTYGEYSNNSSLGIEFDSNAHSAIKLRAAILRGSDLTNVADLLERYTNFVDGFDYRIECNLVEVNGVKKFTKTFTIIPITPPTLTDYLNSLPAQIDSLTRQVVHKLAPGQVVDPSILGANKVVFEYPGNIENINLSENAESSATRVFVTGNSDALGGDAKYAAAVSDDLLKAGWPIYDRTEKVDWPIVDPTIINVDHWGEFDSAIDFHTSAKKFVAESRPPIGDFVITVNGSLNPVVGSYKPGQWCTINVTDKYIRSRLASSLEPRKDVIVRKIDSIKVEVPNNPAFPEKINLSLVTDWQVDKIGQ